MTEGNKNDLVDTQGFEEDFSDAEHKSYKTTWEPWETFIENSLRQFLLF